ncbi:hypothetical protein, partial [Legionella sp. 28fT52]|uniref:hypothetical protein n=1 Tax=Legionella sp. 28fT52 TaxID=3410134 RepID=UPI003AF8DA0A
FKPNNICSSVNLLRFIANTPFLLIDILPDSLIYSGSIFREEIRKTRKLPKIIPNTVYDS